MPPIFGHIFETMGVAISLNSLGRVRIGLMLIFEISWRPLKEVDHKKKIKNSAVELKMCKIYGYEYCLYIFEWYHSSGK